eukprot:scaffold80017_cov71-Phaeocystis_antarctica.AAC.2
MADAATSSINTRILRTPPSRAVGEELAGGETEHYGNFREAACSFGGGRLPRLADSPRSTGRVGTSRTPTWGVQGAH